MNKDKAGLEHWDQTERNTNISFEVFSPLPGVRGFGRRLWHSMFSNELKDFTNSSARLLELGCGGSSLLPYFSKNLGFIVSGIDYSSSGVEITQKMCDVYGISVDLFCQDIFQIPNNLHEKFDVVVSFGVAEHFTNTDATIQAFSKFVRPGGILLTVVPNMFGLCGFTQKLFSKTIFDIHEKISPKGLSISHERSSLSIQSCGYFMFSNFGVINIGLTPSLFKRASFQALRSFTGFIWLLESFIFPFPPNQLTSPYVLCVARKPPSIKKIFILEV